MNYLRILFGGILVCLLFSCSPAAEPFAYIANSGNHTVSVIDTDGNTITGIVTVESQPYGIAVSPDGSKVYVTNQMAGSVSVINTADNSVTTPWTLGTRVEGIAVTPDGSKLYVTNYENESVSVINTSTNEIIPVTVGTNPLGVAVSPDGSTVYVANQIGTVSVINTSNYTATTTVPVGTILFSVAVSPDGSTVYVTNYGTWPGTVSVINTTSGAVATTVPVGSLPYGIAVSPDGSKVYVANQDDGTVSVINTSSDTVTTTVTVGNQPSSVAVTPDGSKVYVTNCEFGTVSVINTTDNSVTTPLSGFFNPQFLGQFILPPAATATPAVTTPVYAGATSVSGTAAAGAEIILRYNGIRKPAVTATGGTWSVPVPALATTDTISVTAWKSPNRMSAPVTATVETPPVPEVTGISPSSGPVTGGTSVVITGTSLTGATAVTFGSVNAASYTVNNATHITATSPAAGAIGTVDITVTTAYGTSATGAADQFTYIVPPTPTPTATPTPTSTPVRSDDSDSSSGSGVGGQSVATARSVTVNQPVSFSFYQTASLTAPVALNAVIITFTQDRQDVQITGMPVTIGGSLPGGTAIGYFQIDPVGINPAEIQQGVISFSVDATWLANHNIDPAQIVMMRNHDNQWIVLPTTLVSQSGSTCTYRATTPGFSYFAVAGLSPESKEHAPVQNATVTAAIPTQPPVQDMTGAFPQTTAKVTTPVPPASIQSTETTAAPAAPEAGNESLPLIAAAFAGIVIAAVGVVLVHRWWIRRQNPALFQNEKW